MAVIHELYFVSPSHSLFAIMQRIQRVEDSVPIEAEALISKSNFSRRRDTFEQTSERSVFFETLRITDDDQLLFGPCYRHCQSSLVLENFVFTWGAGLGICVVWIV